MTAQRTASQAGPRLEASSDRIADALESIVATHGKLDKHVEPSPQNQECKRGDDRRISDLCAQWKAADAAAEAAWWAKWGTLVGGLSGFLVLGALGLAYESNRIARDSARRQLRAYCGMLNFQVRGAQMGGYPEFTVTIANTGQTPARKLRIDTMCWIAPRGQIGYPAEISSDAEVTVGSGNTISSKAFLGYQLTEEKWESLVFGTNSLLLAVRGSYVDVFGDAQAFCTVSCGADFNGAFGMQPVPGHDTAT